MTNSDNTLRVIAITPHKIKISLLTSVSDFSELLYDWRFTANHFVLATSPLRLTTRIFIFQLSTWSYSTYVTSSLTREWVCRLELLLGLASAVILRSEPHGIHDHILLSPIRDSPNLEGQIPVLLSPESESLYDWQSVSMSVLVSSPVWGSWPDIYFDWKLQSCPYGEPSLTRGRVCHLSVIADSKSLSIYTMFINLPLF
jgi:hypothetical protein